MTIVIAPARERGYSAAMLPACALTLPLLTFVVCLPSVAEADPQGISTNVPVQLEDAFPSIGFGKALFQYDGRYTRDTYDPSGRDLLATGPTLKIGALPHLQLSFNPGYNFGSQGSADGGSTSVGGLYQLNDNSAWLPAVGLSASYATPYGAGHKSAQWSLSVAATKFLGDKYAPRIDLDLSWTHVTQPGEGDRAEQLEIGLGYSRLLSPTTALVLDVFHGARSAQGANQNFADVGANWEVTKSLALSIGAGGGIGQQSPPFRIFFALQQEFDLF